MHQIHPVSWQQLGLLNLGLAINRHPAIKLAVSQVVSMKKYLKFVHIKLQPEFKGTLYPRHGLVFLSGIRAALRYIQSFDFGS